MPETQTLELIQVSFGRGVDKQTSVRPHQGIALSVAREPPAKGQGNLDKAQSTPLRDTAPEVTRQANLFQILQKPPKMEKSLEGPGGKGNVGG